jgi:hypothetical protein
VSSYSVSTTAYTLIDGEVADLANSTLFEASVTESWAEATAFRSDAQNIPADIGGFTFTPGTWYASSFIISSASTTVVLDGQGDPGAEFLFQSEDYMSLGAGTKFVLTNGAKWENVLWACKTYFTAGADVDFYGSMLAGTYIVLGANVTVHGCTVSLAAITFGAENLITVVRTMDSASPSITVTASPTATPSHSPPSSPTAIATAAAMATGCDADFSSTSSPTDSPSAIPSASPSASPTVSPSDTPSVIPSSAPTILGSICENFAVHARSAITFAAANKVIGGDVGIFPGTSITGAYTLIDADVADRGDSLIFDVFAEASWLEAVAPRFNTQTIPVEMGGNTFTPGTWHTSTYIKVTILTTVVLDGQGDPNAEFLFQSDSYMEVGANVKFKLINGARWENIRWACTTYFTAGVGVELYGSVLAGTHIIFGATGTVYGCLISLSAITFGADNTITVASTTESASPSDADARSRRKTSAVVEILENKCPEDIQLIAITGTTEHGDVPPIHILSQDQKTVTFQVHQNMFPGSVSYMYTHFHTAPNRDSRCLANASVAQSDTLIFTAGCMHMTPLSIVDLWVVDAALDAVYDTAKLSDRCNPPEVAVLPAVQYTFKLHCVSQCVPT